MCSRSTQSLSRCSRVLFSLVIFLVLTINTDHWVINPNILVWCSFSIRIRSSKHKFLDRCFWLNTGFSGPSSLLSIHLFMLSWLIVHHFLLPWTSYLHQIDHSSLIPSLPWSPLSVSFRLVWLLDMLENAKPQNIVYRLCYMSLYVYESHE